MGLNHPLQIATHLIRLFCSHKHSKLRQMLVSETAEVSAAVHSCESVAMSSKRPRSGGADSQAEDSRTEYTSPSGMLHNQEQNHGHEQHEEPSQGRDGRTDVQTHGAEAAEPQQGEGEDSSWLHTVVVRVGSCLAGQGPRCLRSSGVVTWAYVAAAVS